ncbi:hypothetical protein BpHYR1_027017 [Brachionus plicatilis]|uniref:Uncharacterized protein n=1 Tax=Brachionus plicatilis TaxID=10195 RepID=A0A3M7SPQ7_BRAPC|nr:hypothetical protein BpHYR1_027017 [Brachionus plicatilis]
MIGDFAPTAENDISACLYSKFIECCTLKCRTDDFLTPKYSTPFSFFLFLILKKKLILIVCCIFINDKKPQKSFDWELK